MDGGEERAVAHSIRGADSWSALDFPVLRAGCRLTMGASCMRPEALKRIDLDDAASDRRSRLVFQAAVG